MPLAAAGIAEIDAAIDVAAYDPAIRKFGPVTGVGAVLKEASLGSMPEAHCYLSIEGERFDFTGLRAGDSSPFAALLAEYTSPTILPQIKVELHKKAIGAWARDRGISEELAWSIREACIAALAANAVIM